MSSYHRVYPKLWPDIRGLSSHAKLLSAYILTCKHRNTEGYYHLPVAYAADDLELPLGTVRKAMRALQERDFLSYDEAAQVVFIHKALTYPGQAPKSPTQITGAVNALAHVPPSPLMTAFLAVAHTHARQLHDALVTPSDTPTEVPV